MKHWHHRKNGVAFACAKRIHCHCTKCVQVRRAMRIQHTLRVACCSAGVTHARCQVFVGDVEFNSRCSLQQFFVVVHLITIYRLRYVAFAVVHDDQVLHSCKRWQQRSDQCEQRTINENHFVFGVIHDVGKLLGEQPNVQRVSNSTCARWRKVQLEVSCGIPCKRGNATILRNAQLVQYSTKLTRARSPFAICRALNACGSGSSDGLFAVILLSTFKNVHHG